VTRLRTESDLRRLRYVPARERRPELPPWIDAVLRRALHPCTRKRQEALSEFIQDLRTPGGQYENYRRTALVERNPVVFWQSVTALLALCVMLLLGLRLTGH